MRLRHKGAVVLVVVICAVAIAYGIYAATRPHLFLTIADVQQDLGIASIGKNITLHYRHSVQQTHVWETLQINNTRDGFILTGTKYRSYGVGLPFSPTEGNFRSDGEYFYLENMNRPYKELALRVGTGTELTLFDGEHLYEIYKHYPPGTLVQLQIRPWWYKQLSI